MENDPSQENKVKSKQDFKFWINYLRDFVRHKDSLIYIPESYKANEQPKPYPETIYVGSYLPVSLKRDRVQNVLSLIAILVSVFGTYILFRYTEAAFNQVTETQKATERARQTSIEADVAAKRANKIFMKTERPWVGIALVVQDWNAKEQPTITIVYSNTGRRPARSLGVNANIAPLNRCPENPAYSRGKFSVKSTNIVFPNTPVTNGNKIEETVGQMTAEAKKIEPKQKVYLFAKIDYQDVLTNESHWTHGCWQFLPGYSGATGSFVSCPCYNEVDPEKPEE
jgi:hypothetical protein